MAADVVVVGAGAAGMATALSLGDLHVLVVAARAPGAGGSTPLAQGGLAAAVGADDDPARHAADTEVAGAGWCRPDVVAAITAAAPGTARWLAELGLAFDLAADGHPHLGLEGGHDRRRILHASGDRTGRALADALAARLGVHPRVQVQAGEAVELLVAPDGSVTGVLVDDGTGRLLALAAPATVLATGGLGSAFARTTNPADVRGDGLALALRAGVAVADLELVQFHPTALAAGTDPLPLLTEALRGEGGVLRDGRGAPLMAGLHPRGDLAPRDVVARAVHAAGASAGGAWLDVRPLAASGVLAGHFPGLVATCARGGIDPSRDLLPVVPAAHYAMGGIATDARGATSRPGLWAVGEVACTGLHGANRLASNSLLEAVVVGRWAGADIVARHHAGAGRGAAAGRPAAEPRATAASDADVVADVRTTLAEHLGPVRHPDALDAVAERLAAHSAAPQGRRAADVLAVATAIVGAARRRTASLGAHHVAAPRRGGPDARTPATAATGAR